MSEKKSPSNIEATNASAADFEVRPAVESDLPAIQNVLREYVSQKKLLNRTPAELLSLMQNGFVAVVQGHVVGFSAVEIYSRKLAEIQSLAVASGYQGRGIGSELVKACVERAREKGILEVMAISASEKFLTQLGFDYSLPDQKRALFYQLRSREEMYRDELDSH